MKQPRSMARSNANPVCTLLEQCALESHVESIPTAAPDLSMYPRILRPAFPQNGTGSISLVHTSRSLVMSCNQSGDVGLLRLLTQSAKLSSLYHSSTNDSLRLSRAGANLECLNTSRERCIATGMGPDLVLVSTTRPV